MAVVIRLGVGLVDEHRVMLAGDLLQPVAHQPEKAVVGVNDLAGHVEFDHRLRMLERGHDITGMRKMRPHGQVLPIAILIKSAS